MRFQPTQVLFAIQLTHARDLEGDRIGMFSQPLLYSDEMPSKINFTKLMVTEHHKVYDSYDEKRTKPPECDGYILTDTEGRLWSNQYPTASYGQMSDEGNRRFHRHSTTKEGEEALVAELRKERGSFYECHLLSDVLEKIMKSIKDLSEMPDDKIAEGQKEAVVRKLGLLKQLQEQIVTQFKEAYPEHRLTQCWKKLWAGGKKDWPNVTIHRVIPFDEIHQLSVEQIAMEVTANDKLEIEYAGGDLLCIRDTISDYQIHGETTAVQALEVLFLEKSEEVSEDGKQCFTVCGVELFEPTEPAGAAICFLQRAVSEKPYRARNMGTNIDVIAERASREIVLRLSPRYLEYNFKDGDEISVRYQSGDVMTLKNCGDGGIRLTHSCKNSKFDDPAHRDIDVYSFPEVVPEVALLTFQQVIRAAWPESIMSLQLFQDAFVWARSKYVDENFTGDKPVEVQQ